MPLFDPAPTLASLGGAPLASPALTGDPTAPTASAGDATTELATDAFVAAALGDLWGVGANLNYLPPAPQASTLAMGTASQGIYTRFLVYGYAMSSVYVDIGTSSGHLCVAVFENNTSTPGVPGALVISSGSVSSPGTGIQAISLGGTVTPLRGWWLGFIADNTTLTLRQMSGDTVPGADLWCQQDASSGTFPFAAGTPSVSSGAGQRYPILSATA